MPDTPKQKLTRLTKADTLTTSELLKFLIDNGVFNNPEIDLSPVNDQIGELKRNFDVLISQIDFLNDTVKKQDENLTEHNDDDEAHDALQLIIRDETKALVSQAQLSLENLLNSHNSDDKAHFEQFRDIEVAIDLLKRGLTEATALIIDRDEEAGRAINAVNNGLQDLFVSLDDTRAEILQVVQNLNATLVEHDERITRNTDDIEDLSLQVANVEKQEGPKGEKGDKGDKGDRGADGAMGLNGRDGADGADGDGFVWRGKWERSETYAVNDVVEYRGSSWVAVQAAGRADRAPSNGSDVWQLMAKKGDDGRDGTGTGTSDLTGAEILCRLGATHPNDGIDYGLDVDLDNLDPETGLPCLKWSPFIDQPTFQDFAVTFTATENGGSFNGESVVEKGYTISSINLAWASDNPVSFPISGSDTLTLNGLAISLDGEIDTGNSTTGGLYTASVTEASHGSGFTVRIISNTLDSTATALIDWQSRVYYGADPSDSLVSSGASGLFDAQPGNFDDQAGLFDSAGGASGFFDSNAGLFDDEVGLFDDAGGASLPLFDDAAGLFDGAIGNFDDGGLGSSTGDITGLDASRLQGTRFGTYDTPASPGEYKYVCWPTSYGYQDPNLGFQNADNGSNIPMEDPPQTLTVTNTYGYTQDYYVYRSLNKLGGAIRILVD